MHSKYLIFPPSLHFPSPLCCHSSVSSLYYFSFLPCSSKPTTRIVMCSSKDISPVLDDAIVVQGGGNVGNALTCAARLGLKPRIITKVANDSEGRGILEEFDNDGVDTSFVVVSDEGRSMFSYVIVDSEMKTRTPIYHPGYPPMMPPDISPATLSSALEGARLVYFDGLSLNTALIVAEEASSRNIPILVDAEMGEEGFDKLLHMSDYAVCSAKYPQEFEFKETLISFRLQFILFILKRRLTAVKMRVHLITLRAGRYIV